jgi:hypothetical protein
MHLYNDLYARVMCLAPITNINRDYSFIGAESGKE